MIYLSTRGEAPPVDFVASSLLGLAADGGLYSPERFPAVARPQASDPYTLTATRILAAFAGEALPIGVIARLVEQAYAPFAHRCVTPLVEIGDHRWLLELHHGPTLAFKDVAMRLIAQLYDHVLGERGDRMTILCATSGDTGGAAAAAFAGMNNIDMVILHPHERVSRTQRMFMTSTGASNISNIALEGDFDGAQAILKRLLADQDFRKRTRLAAVNSINWVRVASQAVYFAQAQARLGAQTRLRFIVPTGNFGDALAAYVASRCGLLTDFNLLAAVNANDTMVRLLAGGALAKGATHATLSPAMDIQLPSNFERILFEATGRNAPATRRAYEELARSHSAALPAGAATAFADMGLSARSVTDDETLAEIRRTYAETGEIVCPHTAVGVSASRHEEESERATVVLATAHAAKFPETIERALGRRIELPERVSGIASKPERFTVAPMDEAGVRRAILDVIRE